MAVALTVVVAVLTVVVVVLVHTDFLPLTTVKCVKYQNINSEYYQ